MPINVAQRVLDTLANEGFTFPAGYRLEMGGTVEQETETRDDLVAPMPMIIVGIAAILILTFRSVLLAAVLGVVAIMSVGMAVLSTWLIDFPISFNTFMGTFGLIGVALNDSIVVVAAIRGNARAAAGKIDGIVEAVTGTTRHVIATTLTTIGGFLPLIVIVGGDFWPSMSIVLAGGITGASIMALLFIPAAYRILRRWVAVEATEEQPVEPDQRLVELRTALLAQGHRELRHLPLRHEGTVHALELRGAGGQEEHVALAEQVIGAVLVEDRP